MGLIPEVMTFGLLPIWLAFAYQIVNKLNRKFVQSQKAYMVACSVTPFTTIAVLFLWAMRHSGI